MTATESKQARPRKASRSRGAITAPVKGLFTGPSKWAVQPVIHVELDATRLSPDNAEIYALTERISQLATASESSEEAESQEQPFRKPENAGEVLAMLMLGLQRLGGWDVRIAGAVERSVPGTFDVYCEYESEFVGQDTLTLALRALEDLLDGLAPSAQFFEWFENYIVKRQFPLPRAGRNTQREGIELLQREARRRGIPVYQPKPLLVELGTGRYQRRFWKKKTSDTPHLGLSLVGQKSLTNRLLRERGLPAPFNVLTHNVEEAVFEANDLGYPVAIKPPGGANGLGVVTAIENDDELRRNYDVAMRASRGRGVLVENYLPGIPYRVLVVGGEVVSVLERRVAHVIGDGERTVQELVDATNASPERQPGPETVLAPIIIDERSMALLKRQGYGLDSIPEAGVVVPLKMIPSGSNGGTRVDVTDLIHPDNAEVARQAAKSFGLDLVGIDFVMEDVAKSVFETGGGIIELNTGPGLFPHFRPTGGKAFDPLPAVLNMLYPPGQPVRARVTAIAGSGDVQATVDLTAALLASNGASVGQTLQDGIKVGKMRMTTPRITEVTRAHTVLRNYAVETAVLGLSNDDLEFPGLPADVVDVAILTGFDPSAPATGRVRIEEALARIVSSDGVLILPAGDAHHVDLSHFAPRNVCLVGDDQTVSLLDDHAARGGQALSYAEGDDGVALVLRCGAESREVLASSQLAGVGSAAGNRSMEIVAFAVAAAIAAGIDDESIRRTLTSPERGGAE